MKRFTDRRSLEQITQFYINEIPAARHRNRFAMALWQSRKLIEEQPETVEPVDYEALPAG